MAAVVSLSTEAQTLMVTVQQRRVHAFSRALAALPTDARASLIAALPALTQLQQQLDELPSSD